MTSHICVIFLASHFATIVIKSFALPPSGQPISKTISFVHLYFERQRLWHLKDKRWLTKILLRRSGMRNEIWPKIRENGKKLIFKERQNAFFSKISLKFLSSYGVGSTFSKNEITLTWIVIFCTDQKQELTIQSNWVTTSSLGPEKMFVIAVIRYQREDSAYIWKPNWNNFLFVINVNSL